MKIKLLLLVLILSLFACAGQNKTEDKTEKENIKLTKLDKIIADLKAYSKDSKTVEENILEGIYRRYLLL